jgi:hypothetical protein
VEGSEEPTAAARAGLQQAGSQLESRHHGGQLGLEAMYDHGAVVEVAEPGDHERKAADNDQAVPHAESGHMLGMLFRCIHRESPLREDFAHGFGLGLAIWATLGWPPSTVLAKRFEVNRRLIRPAQLAIEPLPLLLT